MVHEGTDYNKVGFTYSNGEFAKPAGGAEVLVIPRMSVAKQAMNDGFEIKLNFMKIAQTEIDLMNILLHRRPLWE